MLLYLVGLLCTLVYRVLSLTRLRAQMTASRLANGISVIRILLAYVCKMTITPNTVDVKVTLTIGGTFVFFSVSGRYR